MTRLHKLAEYSGEKNSNYGTDLNLTPMNDVSGSGKTRVGAHGVGITWRHNWGLVPRQTYHAAQKGCKNNPNNYVYTEQYMPAPYDYKDASTILLRRIAAVDNTISDCQMVSSLNVDAQRQPLHPEGSHQGTNLRLFATMTSLKWLPRARVKAFTHSE